jgi:bifunctional non-homologous end joining protein LigD
MINFFQDLPEEARKRLRRAPIPEWTSPMLATLTSARFSDPAWIFERKLDGERGLAFRQRAGVRLLSRNRQRLNETYPEIVDAVASQAGEFVIDGEIVAFEGRRTSFEKLQGRIGIKDPEVARHSKIRVFYYVFDLLDLDGYDISRLPLRFRKRLLRRALRFGDPLRYLPHRDREGEAFYKEVCGLGLEGAIAKRADGEYIHGRSRDWLKFKCSNEQEFVIGGFTDPQRTRVGFGALLLGYYENGKLVYAGKVGTGYDSQTLQSLRKRLDALTQASSPFGRGDMHEKSVHWVQPRIVAQVAFSEWTRDGKLRHPRFLGLRTDKAPRDVVRERPSA